MKDILIVIWGLFLVMIAWEALNPGGMQKRYARLSVNRIRLFDLAAAIVAILTIWQLTK